MNICFTIEEENIVAIYAEDSRETTLENILAAMPYMDEDMRQLAAARWISPHCCSGRKIDLPKYDTGLQGHRIPVNSAVVPCSRYSQGSAGKYITRRLPFCGSRRIHFSRLL